MTRQEATELIGQTVYVCWTDRKGQEICDDVYLVNVGFVPLYGPSLVTDQGNITLDRVTRYETVATKLAA